MINPIIKWVGGKRRIANDILSIVGNINSSTYIEPFIGGAGFFVKIMESYTFNKVIISDINKELVTMYNVVKTNCNELLKELHKIQDVYNPLTKEEQKEFYYKTRDEYNCLLKTGYIGEETHLACLFIVLNKLGFNGIYRVNSKGEYNTPFGYRYTITIDDENIHNFNKLLKNVEIRHCSYEEVINDVDDQTLVYIDSPYKELSKTSNFQRYTKEGFNDDDQLNLKLFCDEIHNKGGKFIASNSDPNEVNGNLFFEELYKDYNIAKIRVQRSLSVKVSTRRKVNELVIFN